MGNSQSTEGGNPPRLVEGTDYYWEGGYMVFTSAYHLKRGYCCGSGCRHCPYQEKDEGGEAARRS